MKQNIGLIFGLVLFILSFLGIVGGLADDGREGDERLSGLFGASVGLIFSFLILLCVWG